MSDFEVPEFFKETYRLEGQTLEQERIIKLLENELGAGVDLETTEFRDTVIKSLIKLIKGDNK